MSELCRCPIAAGVLGANDGLVSVASLMMGVGGGTQDVRTLVLSGLSGLVGGALSMAGAAPRGPTLQGGTCGESEMTCSSYWCCPGCRASWPARCPWQVRLNPAVAVVVC